MGLPSRWKGSIVALCAVACGPQVAVDDAGDGTDSDAMTTGPSGPSSVSDVTGASDPTSPTDPSDPSDPSDPTTPDPTGPAPSSNAVDIVLVVDNSGSMGAAQAKVAAAIGTLVDVLDAAGADWRLAVTTTDNGNPWCDGTSPEGGQFVATSCRSRTQDFVFQGAIPQDATVEACLDVCPEEWSTISLPVPWIESSGGVTNLPAGLDPEQALRCILPQGINGCGFEEQLESLYKALLRTTTESEPSYGFLRPEAVLGVLVVTDEVDCSMNKAWEQIFLPDGNRVFWADPDASAPSSAVCWNAGVECTGGPGTYDECHSVNLDVNAGQVGEAAAESDAVLHPVSRYIDYLQGIEDGKQQINPGAEVVFAILGGFQPRGTVIYEDGLGGPDTLDYGIGPGCVSESGRASPPVRMRELADTMSGGAYPNRYSICDPDYTAAFEGFGNAITDLLP